MKKILLIIAAVIIIPVTIGYLYINTVVEHFIQNEGSRILGSNVELSSSNISLFSGQGSLHRFTIANPAGFTEGSAIHIEDIDITLDIGSLFSDTIVVKELSLLSPVITYEINSNGNNISMLEDQITTNTASSEANEHGKKIIIEEFYVKNTQITLTASLLGKSNSEELSFPDIHSQNIGQHKGGLSSSDLSKRAIEGLIRKLGTANLGVLRSQFNNVKDKLIDALQ